jgi:TolA-binding protein
MSQGQKSDVLPPPPPPSAGKRNVKVIALAVVCIVLAASLVGVFVVYQPTNLQAQIKDKNSKISTLQTQVENLTTQLASANSVSTADQNQISSLNTELTNLTNQVNSASSIMTMQSTETLVNSASTTFTNSTTVFDNKLPYPGYVVVQATSNSTTTYAQVIYSVSGVNYNQTVTVGKSGTAAFPVLPTTVEIIIGATDKTAVSETTIITYTY